MTDRSERTKRLGRQQEREIAPGDEAPSWHARDGRGRVPGLRVWAKAA